MDVNTDASMQETFKQVLYETDNLHKHRKNETFGEALVNSLRELRNGNPVPFPQEIVIGVPETYINNDKVTKDFMKKVGNISRDECFKLPVTLEPEPLTTVTGEQITMINVICKYTQDTDIDAIEKYLSK